MKRFYLLILFSFQVAILFSQSFYYSNQKKIYLLENKKTLFVFPSIDINTYLNQVVNPIYGIFFTNETVDNKYGILQLELKDSSLGSNAISILKANSDTKFVWYAMYTKDSVPPARRSLPTTPLRQQISRFAILSFIIFPS